jgi:hypothetical protein
MTPNSVTVTPEPVINLERTGNTEPRVTHALDKVTAELVDPVAEGARLDALIAEIGRHRGGRLSRKQATAARAIIRDRVAAGWTVERVVAALAAATVLTTNGVDFADGQLRRQGKGKTADVLADFLARHSESQT